MESSTTSEKNQTAKLKMKSNVTLLDDKHFESKNESNARPCFEFKKHRIIPIDYTIRSYPDGPNYHNPKKYVFECSNYNDLLEMVDEEKNCPYLNRKNYSHIFTMNQQIDRISV